MKYENNFCRFLEWDSKFFNTRIAGLTQETLTENTLKKALSWCSDNKIECLYFLADSEDKETIKLAEKQKFHLTDIKITLEINLKNTLLPNSDSDKMIQTASDKDIEQLRALASVNHYDSRFYYDGNFSLEKCNELFATWIENSCKGYADVVLAAKDKGKIQGYITCSIDNKQKGSIGLVGVGPNSQGKGIGRLLVTSALKWFGENNISDITVVTQGRNIKAQRLYQRNGFVSESLKIWYHYWF